MKNTLNTSRGGFTGIGSFFNVAVETEYLGSTMVFAQAAAPFGWVKQTTYDNCSLRVVSGAGGVATTSNQPFSTVFNTASTVFPPESGLSVPLGASGVTTVSVAQMENHSHPGYISASLGISGYTTGWPGSGPGSAFTGYVSSVAHPASQSGLAGAGGGHSHASGTVTGITYTSPFNFNVKYKDVILAKYH